MNPVGTSTSRSVGRSRRLASEWDQNRPEPFVVERNPASRGPPQLGQEEDVIRLVAPERSDDITARSFEPIPGQAAGAGGAPAAVIGKMRPPRRPGSPGGAWGSS